MRLMVAMENNIQYLREEVLHQTQYQGERKITNIVRSSSRSSWSRENKAILFFSEANTDDRSKEQGREHAAALSEGEGSVFS